ncbi:ATP-binding protein [Verrucomicrobia bacterium]|nr:response regulator [Verrucomicrobiota bacterium]MDB4746177.1 ATP-binding protein [Verrucomicrobiota bacterium]MDB4798081.1 ATP-binding protein [Verrucomicrobiota bacterium]
MIVEDNDDHAEMYQELLTLETSEISRIDRAQTLREAIDMTHRHAFDAVLLDLGLPDSRGLATLNAFFNQCDSTAVVVMTAQDDEEMGVQAIELGAQDYLQKFESISASVLTKSILYSVERKQRMRELESKNEDLEAFIRSASHDLRSPIGQIVNLVDLAQMTLEEPKVDFRKIENNLKTISETAELTLTLLDELLRFAKLGATELNFATFDLSEIVESIIQQLPDEDKPLVKSRDLQPIHADRALVTILIQNLIQNGLRYRSESTPQITVSARRTIGNAIIEVADNGIGIAKETQPLIFGIGFRGTHSNEYPGHGFGLSTCRRIMKAHRGSITVKSEVGKGSSFALEFPQFSIARP